MSRFLYHTSCPKCNSRDNRGIYDDESSYCFGCGYFSSGRYIPSQEIKEKVENPLPTDLTQEYSKASLEWITKYDITVEECLRHNVYFSPSNNQLLFIFYTKHDNKHSQKFNFLRADGNRSGWGNKIFLSENEDRKLFASARNLNPSHKSRYTTYGEILCEHFRIIQCYIKEKNIGGLSAGRRIRTLVLVEDCLSAIKIARQSDSYPLLTSTISLGSIKALASLLDPSTGRPRYDAFLVWLDGNMFHRAQRIARQFQMLGKEARAVYTEKDPKEYRDIEIEKILDNTP